MTRDADAKTPRFRLPNAMESLAARINPTIRPEGDKIVYVSPKEIAYALRNRESDALPREVIDYIAATLAGEIQTPRGRKPLSYLQLLIREQVIPVYYQQCLAFVQRRYARWTKAKKEKTTHHVTEKDLDYGWSALRGQPYWEGEPHERAARITAQRWLGDHEKYKTVLNLSSSQK